MCGVEVAGEVQAEIKGIGLVQRYESLERCAIAGARRLHVAVGLRIEGALNRHHNALRIRRSASALCRVSSYSRSGSESATMPAPTWN